MVTVTGTVGIFSAWHICWVSTCSTIQRRSEPCIQNEAKRNSKYHNTTSNFQRFHLKGFQAIVSVSKTYGWSRLESHGQTVSMLFRLNHPFWGVFDPSPGVALLLFTANLRHWPSWFAPLSWSPAWQRRSGASRSSSHNTYPLVN